MITTQLHFLNVENRIPPHSRFERINSVGLVNAKNSLKFAISGSGNKLTFNPANETPNRVVSHSFSCVKLKLAYT